MNSRKTVCFTGMDSAEGDRLKAQFLEANRRSGEHWTLSSDTDADMLVIDVDSLYGHMTWLKMHNSGRAIVALSSSATADADHVLLRPVTVDALAALLAAHAGASPPRPAAARVASKPAEAPNARPSAPAPRAATANPASAAQPAPAPAAPAATSNPSPMSASTPSSVPAARSAPPVARPEPRTEPELEPEPVLPPRDPRLSDYLQPGALPGPVKLKLGDAPVLALDPISRTYLGPAALKGFASYAKAIIRPEEWVAVSPHEFDRLKTEMGGAQPFMRLQWLAALILGEGRLLPGYDPNQRFRLLKWPQIEREYPKHFRIATAMMKGPQLLTEIAEGSSVALAEVVDFVNASLATGVAEMEASVPATDAAAAAKSGGLLGRLRGGR